VRKPRRRDWILLHNWWRLSLACDLPPHQHPLRNVVLIELLVLNQARAKIWNTGGEQTLLAAHSTEVARPSGSSIAVTHLLFVALNARKQLDSFFFAKPFPNNILDKFCGCWRFPHLCALVRRRWSSCWKHQPRYSLHSSQCVRVDLLTSNYDIFKTHP